MSDVYSLNGSTVERTSPLGATWAVRDFSFDDDAELDDPGDKKVQVLDAHIEQGAAHLRPDRAWTLVVEADVSALPGSDVTAKLRDGWAELVKAFDPRIGVVDLQCARADTSAATVTRRLITRLTSVPSFTPRTAKPSGLDGPGAYEGGGGYIVYPVKGRTLFPYWIGSTLLTLDHSEATANVAIGASPDTVTIDNDSQRWVGARFTFGSMSGTVTKVTIDNAANSDQLVITHPTGFANGDYLDVVASDPRKNGRSSLNVRFGGGTYRMRLEPGSNVLTCNRTGGSGTGVITVTYPELFLTN